MHPFEDLIVPDNAVGIHWFGQSSYAIKSSSGTVLQVDPYFPRERPADRFIHPRPPLHEPTLRTDFVLFTHSHGDHTCLESVTRIRAAFPDTQFIGPVESIQKIIEAGFPAQRTAAITAGENRAMAEMKAHAVWAKPPDGIAADDIAPPDVQHLGYVIDAGAARIYISGDPVNTFAEHERLVAPVKVLKPDIGFLTTHPTEGEFPYLDGAAKLAAQLGLKAAAPSHYQCFVRRNYDPEEFAGHLTGTEALIIPYNQSVVYTPS
jgi:L-ascorbate metabolism protein UlaG (beta-lactamase superfamily)